MLWVKGRPGLSVLSVGVVDTRASEHPDSLASHDCTRSRPGHGARHDPPHGSRDQLVAAAHGGAGGNEAGSMIVFGLCCCHCT